MKKELISLHGTAREYYIPGPDDYIVGRMPTLCGQSEAQDRKYFKHIGKSGKIWLVADQPNSADSIYVEGGPNSKGFGGSTLEFQLVSSESIKCATPSDIHRAKNGFHSDTFKYAETIKLKGPWHSNDSALFADTGIDIRDKHYTLVVIGEEVKYGKHYETIVHKVLYKEEEPVLGFFHRGDILGREWAQKFGQRVFTYRQSRGGSTLGFVEPDAVFYWEKEHKPVTASPAQTGIIFS
jgi:hypothetical protein